MPVPTPRPYLTFSSPEEFSISVDRTYWNGTMEYSTDAQNWSTWDGSAISGTALYLRGTKNTRVTDDDSTATRWALTGSNISCTGNIENLLDYKTVALGEHPEMADDCFPFLFAYCTGLTTAPELPATRLSRGCYVRMFYQCTSLTTVPKLPATTLAESCYADMFCGCTNLKLSATQTDEYTQAYRIPTNGEGTAATGALSNMFSYTGGTFTDTPEINTTYYLHKDCSIV